MIWLYTLVSVFIVSLISFVGLLSFGLQGERLSRLLIYFISLAAGSLFGDAFFHIIPEIVRREGFGFHVSLSFLGGIVLFLFMEKAIHLQQYHSFEKDNGGHESHARVRPFVLTNLFADAIHNFGDGLIIAASYLTSVPIGLATSMVVAFHEIPHEIGNFSILVHGGLSRGRALFLNFVTALVSVLGALVALLLSGTVHGIELYILPIVAGGFIYVAGSDLIPELHKESESLQKVLLQLVVFLLGIALMALLLLIE